MFVATCCDLEEGKATDTIVAKSDMATLINCPPNLPAGASTPDIALPSARRDCVEPTWYHAALTIAQASDWQTAIQKKYDSCMDNDTWELVDIPADRTLVNSMWIYKIKSGIEGAISRFKASFVAKGCSQRAGLDYTETFSLVINMAILRLFLAIAIAMDLDLCQLDIDTAFMYAPITEDLIRQLLWFSDGTSRVCHIKRCMYGLKQSPAKLTCYSGTCLSTLIGNTVSPTRASTSSAPAPSSR
jgi:hypothetical protein